LRGQRLSKEKGWWRIATRDVAVAFVPFLSLLIIPTFLTAITNDHNEWTVVLMTIGLSVAGSLLLAPRVRRWLAARVRPDSGRAFVLASDEQFPRRVLVATFAGRRNLEPVTLTGPNTAGVQQRPSLLRFLVHRSSPEHLVVLTTPQVQREVSSTELAARLSEWFGTNAPTLSVCLVPADEFAPTAVLAAVTEAVRRSGASLDDVVVDGTAGTSIMSVSAYGGAQAAGVAYQSVRQDQGAVSVLLPFATTGGEGFERRGG
jgi:hypothetical protein